MKLDTIDREEFDRRLQQSTEQMRSRRLALEAQSVALQDLIGRYSAVLEQIEAETGQETEPLFNGWEELRSVLTELAERTSAMAATL